VTVDASQFARTRRVTANRHPSNATAEERGSSQVGSMIASRRLASADGQLAQSQ
jgi:hypothetical protein